MTDLLDTLSDRANRAHPDPDVDSMVDGALVRGRRLAHRRRAGAAGAAGVLALAAVTVGLVILLPDHSNGKAGVPPLAQPEPSTSASSSSTASTPLVVASPAPKEAPVSLGLVPAGWVVAGYAEDVTEYRAATDRKPSSVDSFEGKIVVGPHDDGGTLRKADYPERVGKYNASYRGGADGQMISLLVKGSTTVDFQIPAETRLSKANALRMAASITIRDLSHPGHG